jgi:hypothetical protein
VTSRAKPTWDESEELSFHDPTPVLTAVTIETAPTPDSGLETEGVDESLNQLPFDLNLNGNSILHNMSIYDYSRCTSLDDFLEGDLDSGLYMFGSRA